MTVLWTVPAAVDAARRLADPQRLLPAGQLDHSVATGSAGLGLCFAQLASVTGDDRDRRAAERYLGQAIDHVAAAPLEGGIGIFGGLVGVAWAEVEVSRTLGWEAEPSEDVDTLLAELLDREPWPGPWDLVSGLAGVGAYALRRPGGAGPDLVALVVRALARAVQGTGWRTETTSTFGAQGNGRPERYIDLGLAHGVPGAIAFLAGALDAGCEPARWVLAEGVGQLLEHELPPGAVGGRFPAVAWPGRAPRPSRLAWCYGDAGVAAALLAAGEVLDDHLATAAGRRALASAAARPLAGSGVSDAALCHGASGVALLFHRLGPYGHGAPEAAAAWTTHLLDEVHAGRLPSTPGLLEGRAGVVLALLAVAGHGGGWESVLLNERGLISRRGWRRTAPCEP